MHLWILILHFCVHTVHFDYLLFISILTNAQRKSSIKSILQLLQHVSVFLRHPQRDYKFCPNFSWRNL